MCNYRKKTSCVFVFCLLLLIYFSVVFLEHERIKSRQLVMIIFVQGIKKKSINVMFTN